MERGARRGGKSKQNGKNHLDLSFSAAVTAPAEGAREDHDFAWGDCLACWNQRGTRSERVWPVAVDTVRYEDTIRCTRYNVQQLLYGTADPSGACNVWAVVLLCNRVIGASGTRKDCGEKFMAGCYIRNEDQSSLAETCLTI